MKYSGIFWSATPVENLEGSERPRCCEIPETFMVVPTGIFGIEMKAIGYLYWIPWSSQGMTTNYYFMGYHILSVIVRLAVVLSYMSKGPDNPAF